MKVITIAGLGWIPLIALALWWAGFAPFPQHPVYTDTVCTEDPMTKTDMDTYGVLRSCSLGGHFTEQEQTFNGGSGGWAQCPPSVAPLDPKTLEPVKMECFSWKQTYWHEVPAFGFFSTPWIAFTYRPHNEQKPNWNSMDVQPLAAYHSYAACWFAHRNDALCKKVPA